jgi:D-galacturonate reductase
VRADQCHRGYNWSTDDGGFAALNPLYMKYTPDGNGFFAGQQGVRPADAPERMQLYAAGT